MNQETREAKSSETTFFDLFVIRLFALLASLTSAFFTSIRSRVLAALADGELCLPEKATLRQHHRHMAC
jgi:hypothetical protein